MKYFLTALLLVGSAAFAQDAVPEIPFDSVANLLKLPPDLYLGEVSGVALNSKGHIFVYSRVIPRAPLMPRQPRNSWSSVRMESTSVRSAGTCMPGRSPMP